MICIFPKCDFINSSTWPGRIKKESHKNFKPPVVNSVIAVASVSAANKGVVLERN